MTNADLKEKKRAAKLRRRQEAMMRDLQKMNDMPCGHADCAAFNAGAQAVAQALDWALAQKVPTEWLNAMLSKGLFMAMVVNRLTPDDIDGTKSQRAPHEVN
jgi:hypothetical protein